MIYREYGRTGIEVSAVGFGGMRFRDQNNVDECAALVKSAYDAGINYFDTAPGCERSEALFGVAFREMLKTRKDRPFHVSTKTMGGEPGRIRSDLENSLTRMGLDCIDFYHVWCMITPRAFEERGRSAIKTFEKLKDEGLMKHISVSSHMSGADTAVMLKQYPFAGLLMGYSAMNFPYREAALDTARELGCGVAVMNPLGGGLIPRYPERFAFVRTREDESVVEGALRFLLNDSRITLSFVGFADRAELREAISAGDGFKRISGVGVAKIRAGVKAAFNSKCTSCGYCDRCPNGLPLPKLMQSYDHYMLSGRPQDMIDHMNSHWCLPWDEYHLNDCIQCGICEEACTQQLDIMARVNCIREEPWTRRSRRDPLWPRRRPAKRKDCIGLPDLSGYLPTQDE